MNTLPNSSGRKSSANPKIWLFLSLSLGCVGLFVLSLLFGSTEMSLLHAICAILDGNVSDADYRILLYIRLPRAIASLAAGSALAVSGALIQAVLQNPMAAPNIIGVNSGAGLAATLTIAVFPSALSFLPLSAFFGALAACLLIYAISAKTSASKLTITLVGIAVGSVLNAGINTVKVIFPDSVYDTDIFMIGGFSGVTYEKLLPACVVIAAALIVSFCMAKNIDILGLGGKTAQSLGMNVALVRFLLLVLASALAGAAVSFAGLLGFVGLLVPHIMRKFVGNRHRELLFASALCGGCLVLLCDLLSRVIFAPYELPVGILLSLVGGCFFICLVLFGKRGETI